VKTKAIINLALSVLPAVLCIPMSGCAPTRAFVRTGPSFSQVVTQISHVGIINDVVLARDLVGTNDYFCIEDSKCAAAFMLEDAKTYLTKKGYRVDFASTPFVGAFKNPDLKMNVACKYKDPINNRYSPFFICNQLAQDEAYQQALTKVFRRILMAVEQKGDSPTEVFRRDPSVQENLKIVSERTHAEFVFIVIGNGTVVSTGKQIGQGLATGLVTGLLSLGTVVVTAHSVSFLDSFVALVDLRNAEIVWSNSFRLRDLNPLKQGTYRGAWSKSLLYHFPATGAGAGKHKSNVATPNDGQRIGAIANTAAQAKVWKPESKSPETK